MNILMFGWEFPPHISGGLGTACYGMTKAISAIPGMDLTFVVPKTWGDEPAGNMKLIGASDIDLIKSKIRIEQFKMPFTCLSVQSEMVPYVDPEQYKHTERTKYQIKEQEAQHVAERIKFTGQYTPDLMTEIHNFSVVGEHIAGQGNYDIIHAHDWLTFPAGILAKKITGKPLVVHVHATDFDRGGGKANPDVFKIEQEGMKAADKIITVSDLTGKIVASKYGIEPSKIITVHNGVEPFNTNSQSIKLRKNKTKLVTFLGRITMQKGPQYFVEVAEKVLNHTGNVEFVMAGSGDMMNEMVEMVKDRGLTKKFHFPGFLKGEQVTNLLELSEVYIMPSVSEPFGISPLEAMFCNVPVIISKQSGVSEVIQHAIKVDFWDTDAMADAVYSILNRPVLKWMLKRKGAAEVKKIGWEKTASKIFNVYNQFKRA